METKTIVVVDDNPFIANMIQEALNDVPGYQAVTVNDGMTALQFISNAPPDLVILDVYVPKISGRDLYDRLQHDPGTAQIPVLLMSAAMPHPELAKRSVLEYLRKPFDMNDLLGRVHDLLRPSRPHL